MTHVEDMGCVHVFVKGTVVGRMGRSRFQVRRPIATCNAAAMTRATPRKPPAS
jgi:hypothetical protein